MCQSPRSWLEPVTGWLPVQCEGHPRRRASCVSPPCIRPEPAAGWRPVQCRGRSRHRAFCASPVGHVPRRGCWPYVTGLLVKPPAPGPFSVQARAQRSEGCSQLAPLLSIRLSEGLFRATESSPRAFLSVFHEDGMLPILRTGIRVGLGRSSPTSRTSVEGQLTGR